MSSKFLSFHSHCKYPFCDHINVRLCFPSFNNPRSLSVTKHYCSRIKLKSLHFNHKHGVNEIMCLSENDHREPESPISRKTELSEWKKWTLGIVLSVVLPSFGHKMGPLFLIKSKVDTAMKTVEEVIEVVEEVAEATEKLGEMVEEKLPEDSMLKKEVDVLENLSKTAVEGAKKAQEILHQIEDVEDELTGSLIEPGTDQAPGVINQEANNKDRDQPVKT